MAAKILAKRPRKCLSKQGQKQNHNGTTADWKGLRTKYNKRDQSKIECDTTQHQPPKKRQCK